MTQAVHLDHHPFVFWNWTCLRLKLISTSWGFDQSFFLNTFFCTTPPVPPRCGPAAPGSWRPLMVWSCSGSSDTRRSRLVLVGATAGADCWATGFCLHLFASRLSRMFVSVLDSETLVIQKWDLSLRFWDDWSRCSQKLAEFATSINVFRVFLLFTHGRRTIISRYLLSYY